MTPAEMREQCAKVAEGFAKSREYNDEYLGAMTGTTLSKPSVIAAAIRALPIPDPQPVDVTVKPLVWERMTNGAEKADTPLARYVVSGGCWSLWTHTSGETRHAAHEVEAKAAAQADYAARIAAALDPAAVDALVRAAEQRGREAGLREAAQAVANDAGEFDHPATHYTFGRLAEKILALITKEAAP